MEPHQIVSRIDLINYLVRTRGYTRYLEIGCANNDCFDRVQCETKTGVDPASGGTHRMTSDVYFAQLSPDVQFDIVFIDGLHWCEQVDRDVANSLTHLAPNGIIVLHDCNPPTPAHAVYPPPLVPQLWNGDVWRSIVGLRFQSQYLDRLDVAVGDFDWGCGVVVPRASKRDEPTRVRIWERQLLPRTGFDHRLLPYEFLDAHRADILRTLPAARLIQWIETGV